MRHIPTGSAGAWWSELGRDADIETVGVVLTREKLAEIRAHNTGIDLARRRENRNSGARKAAATAAARRATRRS